METLETMCFTASMATTPCKEGMVSIEYLEAQEMTRLRLAWLRERHSLRIIRVILRQEARAMTESMEPTPATLARSCTAALAMT